jgi:predicted metal-binding membrane protein
MEQGLYCLGCCWALMLVMLVVGTMNLAWMAFFTLFAIVEKSGQGRVTSTLSGGILLAWGGILLVVTLMQAQ